MTAGGRLVGSMLLVGLLGACAASFRPEGDDLAKAIDPSLLAAAAAAEANHDYRAAANHYGNLLRRNPGDRDLLLRFVRGLRYSGQAAQAIEILNGVIKDKGRDYRLLMELGKAELAADRTNLAVRHLHEARTLSPNDWEVHSALGVALDYQRKHAAATEAYQAALALSPANPVILNNLALSLAQQGAIDAAIAALHQAIDQDDASAQTRQNLALLLALKGDVAAAERLVRKDLPPEMVRGNMNYYRSLADLRHAD